MAKLVWRVKLVAELEPGVVTETELAHIERDEQAGLAELGLRLDEAKWLMAALLVHYAARRQRGEPIATSFTAA